MNHNVGRKKHSAEDVVRKLRRADELAAACKTNEEIAAELKVSAAALYNWRRACGGMDFDAAKELEELREQNTLFKRLLAEAELEKDALARWPRENLSPDAKRRVNMLKEVLGMFERLACQALGLARCTYRRIPDVQTPLTLMLGCANGLRDYCAKRMIQNRIVAVI